MAIKFNLQDILAFVKSHKIISRALRSMGKQSMANAASMLGFGRLENGIALGRTVYSTIQRELAKSPAQRKGIISLMKEMRLLSRFAEMYGYNKTARVMRLMGFGARKVSRAVLIKRLKKLNREVFGSMSGCGRVLDGRVNLEGSGFFSFVKKAFNAGNRLQKSIGNAVTHPGRTIGNYITNTGRALIDRPISTLAGKAVGFIPGVGFIAGKVGGKAVQYGVHKLTGLGVSRGTARGVSPLIMQGNGRYMTPPYINPHMLRGNGRYKSARLL